MQEFDVIDRYFCWQEAASLPDNNDAVAGGVVTGIGDDAAILNVPQNKQLVISIDTLVSGVHFPENTAADAIAHKALMVNLSDLAAMGASPAWFTLALTLPEIDEKWLEGFSAGLKTLAKQHQISLVGGDTTRGPLTISIQVTGLVKTGHAYLRKGAKVGDRIYVTGTLGDAAAGLDAIQHKLKLSDTDFNFCLQRLNKPQARLAESRLLDGFVSSCIDVSDGLLQDLSHILKASGVGAKLNLANLPLSTALESLDKKYATQLALAGGDDYELLFTVPEDKEAGFLQNMNRKVTCIGLITNETMLIRDKSGHTLKSAGYNHFDAV